MNRKKFQFLFGCFSFRAFIAAANEDNSGRHVPTFVPAMQAFDQCTDGMLGEYPCSMMDLDAFLPTDQFTGSQNQRTNDIWGWTDSKTSKEYAIVGFQDGTAFVDVSTPTSPVYLGFLASHTGTSTLFRDMKTYDDYAFIVADEVGHGMQIFDLTQLSSISNVPVLFRETAHFEINFQGSKIAGKEIEFSRYYDKVTEAGERVIPRQSDDEGYAHNIAINEESGYAYLVGSNNCAGGLYMLDLSNPLSPSSVGCFSDWGWISDAQCVTYDGPDSTYRNREICFISYLYGLAVVDVTNKSNPEVLSFLGEVYFNFIDQGWLTDDHAYFLVGDRNGGDVHTHIVDASDLNNIVVANTYEGSIDARHGNNFVKGNYLYQANHKGGLYLLELSNVSEGIIDEVGYFDTTPNESGSGQAGVRGVYPFFSSGIVIASSANEGLFVIRPRYSSSEMECVNNKAGSYPCMDVALKDFLSSDSFPESSNNRLSDVWGWTDSSTGKEYALVGLRDGTAFVDISSPSSPVYLGFLEAHGNLSGSWRDIKTYDDYAYIVADVVGHGMQIFDLRQLTSVTNGPVIFRETAHFQINSEGWRFTNPNKTNFDRFYDQAAEAGERVTPREINDEGYAHNIAINEDTGYAYLIGSNNCNGGLYMLDLSNPLSPTAEGCFSDWGWISDAQCVSYDGPDNDYSNSEVCFVSYSIGVGVVDVTNKRSPRVRSSLEESEFNIIDQGWLTEDQSYFLVGDKRGGNTRTHIVDVTNLDDISVSETYKSSLTARHGNSFVNGKYLYQSYNRGGLRIFDLSDISDGVLNEVGYFDTTPNKSGSGQDGVMGVYPFFSSGVVIVSSVNEGLFILDPFSSLNQVPTQTPSLFPAPLPTNRPTPSPTNRPTPSPTNRPTPSPTNIPTPSPTKKPTPSPTNSPTFDPGNASSCVNNKAGSYPCMDVALKDFLSSDSFPESSNNRLSDVWGWTDSSTGKEYALVGLRDGTAFVDISSPSSPVYLGFLEAHGNLSGSWRDIKTYDDYAYIVADVVGHGMQIFDLRQLTSVTNGPVIFRETAHFQINSEGWRFTNPNKTNFDRFYDQAAEAGERVTPREINDEGYAHNIAINEDTGYAYLIGSNNCNGGLYMLDLSNPLSPTAEGCFSDWGWISDAQCVSYDGPDNDYSNSEVCFVSYSIGVGVVDVTNKRSPRVRSSLEESEFNIIDQGWLTEDQSYFLVGDKRGGNTRTHIVDVTNLDDISVSETYKSSLTARHGNSFVNGKYLYQSYNRGGLRIFDLSDISDGVLDEVGYFDTTPNKSGSGQDGVMGVYPFFSSGVVIVSSVNEGLFILDPSPVITFPLPECSNPLRDYLQVDVQVDDFATNDKNSYILSYYRKNRDSWTEVNRKRSFENNERYVWGSCEKKRECYRLLLKDDNGDGICCDKGAGFYNMDFNGVKKSGTFDSGSRLIEYIGDCDSVPL